MRVSYEAGCIPGAETDRLSNDSTGRDGYGWVSRTVLPPPDPPLALLIVPLVPAVTGDGRSGGLRARAEMCKAVVKA